MKIARIIFIILGLSLVSLGIWLLADKLGELFDALIPLIPIGLGVWILNEAKKMRQEK